MGLQGDEKSTGDEGGGARRGGGSHRVGTSGTGGAQKGHRPKKSETNFIDAYSGASELAPPPVSRDIMAVPAKLRRIMNLRASVASGEKYDPNGHKRRGKDNSKTSRKKDAEKKRKRMDEKSGSNEATSTDNVPSVKKLKLSRAEEELKLLNAKFDKKAGVKPKSTGEKWKCYLNEKRKKGKKSKEDDVPAMNLHENIQFGDIVQAPPKLSFPKRASAIKEKEQEKSKGNGDQNLLHERLRLQAIESYRARKKWSERPGQQLPSLDLGTALPDL